MKFKKLVWVAGLMALLTGCSAGNTSSQSTSSTDTASTATQVATSSQDTSASQTSSQAVSSSAATNTTNDVNQDMYQQLANTDFNSGDNVILEVNQNKSTLNPNTWQQEKIDYGNLDNLNRTTTDTAYLSRQNLGRSAGREGQRWQPTGWHNQPKYINGKRLYPQNRGHLLAYTITFNFDDEGRYQSGLSGSIDNPKNLATQTDFSNKNPMQDYEEQVRDGLQAGKKIIYQVTTVFRGDELMCRGYWVQAISTDGTVNFNAYVFNVEPNVVFNYSTGYSNVNNNFDVTYNGQIRS